MNEDIVEKLLKSVNLIDFDLIVLKNKLKKEDCLKNELILNHYKELKKNAISVYDNIGYLRKKNQ